MADPEVAAAPLLEAPSVIESQPGTHPLPVADVDVDAYCLTHNETSTGVAMPLQRPSGATEGQLVLPPNARCVLPNAQVIDRDSVGRLSAVTGDEGFAASVLLERAVLRADEPIGEATVSSAERAVIDSAGIPEYVSIRQRRYGDCQGRSR